MTHHITLDAEGRIFDMVALGAHLAKLTDRRQARGKRYSLSFLLSVIVLAKLSGQNRPSAIADWLKLRSDVLVKLSGERSPRGRRKACICWPLIYRPRAWY